MSESAPETPATQVKLMSGVAYRESLRSYRPKVYVDGREVACVADEASLQPGINALGFTYDCALRAELEPIALATQSSQSTRGRVVSRMLHVNESAGDLLNKLEPCACCARRPAAPSATWPTMP
jgi:4-hydroxybutyryl-CoA dehydratase/vinylacetyl-CoA-Delta-isomerase